MYKTHEKAPCGITTLSGARTEKPFSSSAISKTHYVIIGSNHHGRRIDNFLMSLLKGLPKSHLYRMLRKGEVRVNRKRATPDFKVQEGDRIRIPPMWLSPPENKQVAHWLLEAANRKALHEDAGLLVVDKPSGIVVHSGSRHQTGLIDALRQAKNSSELTLAHRLDRETSGCLIVAKNHRGLRFVHEALREHRTEKYYLALVCGTPNLRAIDTPLSKKYGSDYQRVGISASGKPALTLLRVVKSYHDTALVRLKLLTGRTHQLRVHLASIGHPIAGDHKYGSADFNKIMATRGLRRLFLHARTLRLPKIIPGETIIVKAPLPDELSRALIVCAQHEHDMNNARASQ